MCVACAEFIKDKLTLKEYQSALWEMTRPGPDGEADDAERHLVEIESVFRGARGDQEKIRQGLRQLVRSN